ncbi:MAG TPA: hypothetical protein VFV61_05345 [Pyrinomonadaceae bacterium]|nr:hypothetical protein [Pyrinomonadaceae bacterium]
MKAIILKSLLLSLVVCFGTPAFGQATGTKPETVPDVIVTRELPLDVGQLDGVNYVNNFFGLSLSIPGDWILVQGRNKEIAQASKKLLANEEAKQRAEFEKSIEQSTILLSLTRVPSGAPNNASLLVIAERLSSPAIKNGVDALRTLEAMTKNTSFLVEFQSGIRSETINGVEFGVATIKTTSGTDSFMQKVYMVVKKGYGVEFFFTYKDPAHLATYDAFMKTVKIK